MLKRTITAVVAIALFIPVCIYSDTVVFPTVMALLSVIGVFEMLGCVGVRKHYILAGISLVFGAMPIVPFFAGESTLKIIARTLRGLPYCSLRDRRVLKRKARLYSLVLDFHGSILYSGFVYLHRSAPRRREVSLSSRVHRSVG